MDKLQTIEQLTQLRTTIEAETEGLTMEQACLLTDVCQVLGFSQWETCLVVGNAITILPLKIRIMPAGHDLLRELEDEAPATVVPAGPMVEEVVIT